VETLQAFGALFQIPHYYRKFLHCKLKMLCNYVINTVIRIKVLLFLLYVLEIFFFPPRVVKILSGNNEPSNKFIFRATYGNSNVCNIFPA
jgi:hypothetical protein